MIEDNNEKQAPEERTSNDEKKSGGAGGYTPMTQDQIRRVRLWVFIGLSLIALIIILIKVLT